MYYPCRRRLQTIFEEGVSGQQGDAQGVVSAVVVGVAVVCRKNFAAMRLSAKCQNNSSYPQNSIQENVLRTRLRKLAVNLIWN